MNRQPNNLGARALLLALSLLAAALTACSGTTSAPPDDGDPTTPPPASTWSKSLGGPNDDWANAVIATRDGGYLLAGVMNHQEVPGADGALALEGDFWVTRLDSLGDPVWNQAIGEQRSASAGAVVAYRRVRAGATGYWMIGTQTIPGASGVLTNRDAQVDLQVARLDDSGAVVWARSYDSGTFGTTAFFESNASAQDRGWDIAPMADGGALAVAWSSAILRADASNGVPAGAPWVVRLSATGDILWQRRLAETQYQYIADEPAELLVRESAEHGAVVAASARLRGSDLDPAVQLTLLDGGGTVHWSQRYSRLLARDLLQVAEDQDGVANDDIVIGGIDYGVRLTGGSSTDDDDTIVMKFHLEDGTEDWRQVMDDGVTLNAMSQQCRQRPDSSWLCYYIAVGSGRVDDEGPEMAMALRIGANGSRDSTQFFPELATATDVAADPSVPLTVNTPLVIIGHAHRTGGAAPHIFRATITPTLNTVGLQVALADASVSGLPLTELALLGNSQILASRVGLQSFALRRFAVDGSPLLSRDFGGDSERRGERAFDAIEVNGGFIVAGQADGAASDASHPATLLAKLNMTGAVDWQSTLRDLSLVTPRQVTYEALAESGDGGAVIVGAQGRGAGGADLIRAVRLDASGNVSWTSVPLNAPPRGFGSLTVGAAYASSVQRANDGGYFVTGGIVFDADADVSNWLTKIDPMGAIRWQREWPGGLRITSLRSLIDGGAVLAGITTYEGARRPWAARVAADGALAWTQTYSVDSADSDPVARITLAADGGYLLATSHLLTDDFNSPATQAAAGRRNALLIRLNADGTARWNRTYGGLLDETLYGLDSTSDGGFVVAGRSDSLGERGEAWVMRLGADGLINAGCNALRSERAGTNYAALTPSLRTFSGTGAAEDMIAGSSAALPSNLPSRAPAGLAVARQCSGFAQSDGGGTPPAGLRLTVVQGNTATPGVVTSTPAGISCGTGSNICEAHYLPNTTVTLRVDPGEMSRFLGWSGCDIENGGQCLVTVTADRSVTATFRAANSPSLNMSVTGNGQVNGSGLSCRASGGVCGASFAPGDIATLTAVADATEAFIGWGGDCASFLAASPIDVEVSAVRNCTAQFTGAPFGSPVVSITIEPAQVGPVVGYVRSVPRGLTCGSIGQDCSQSFAYGTTVRLDGVSTDGNWTFESFRCSAGIQTPGARSLAFVAESNVTCIGTLASDVERLGVKIVADRLAASPGRVVSQDTVAPRHLDCDADCDRPFTSGSTVTLRAVPDNAHVLSNWSGCDSESIDPAGGSLPPLCKVLMSRTRNVAAAFTTAHIGTGDFLHVLSIDFPYDSGDGSVEYSRPAGVPPCTPQGGTCAHDYDHSSATTDEVTLTIRPAGNNALILNEGCAVFTPATATAPATCSVFMDRDRGVTFGFSDVNAAPIAVITSTPSGTASVNQVIAFSGASSTDDEDVSQLNFQWDFDEDSVTDATGITATHAFAEPGVHRVQLQVVDRAGSVSFAYANIVVIADNTPPNAFFNFSPGLALVGNPVTFDASVSSDSNGIASYRWDFDGDGVDDLVGDATTARIAMHTFNAFGTYTVRLRVVDNLGAVGETTREVSVGLATGGASLTLNLLGGGHGVVGYVPIVGACSKDSELTCVRQFPVGTQVVLTATAYSGSALGDWVGCTSLNETGTICTVNLTADRTVKLFIN